MKDELIALAKEAGFDEEAGEVIVGYYSDDITDKLERFAALVAAKEREKVAKWMMQRALATGHGDTIEDMLTELEWQIREKEREACALVCDDMVLYTGFDCAAAIRARKP